MAKSLGRAVGMGSHLRNPLYRFLHHGAMLTHPFWKKHLCHTWDLKQWINPVCRDLLTR